MALAGKICGPTRYSSLLNHVADRFDLRKDIAFKTSITAAHFIEEMHRWSVETDSGERIFTRFLIMATGCISTTNMPDIEGLSDYQGKKVVLFFYPLDFTFV